MIRTQDVDGRMAWINDEVSGDVWKWIEPVSENKVELDIKEAMKVVTSAITNDEAYRIGWKANIAMAFKDCSAKYGGSETDHVVANEAADNFLNILCRGTK